MRGRWNVRLAGVLALAMAVLMVQAAWAGKFHFNSVSFSLGSLVLQGDLAGLGNEAAEVTLTGYGTVKAMCQNKGGQQAQGRNPIFVNSQQTAVFVTDEYGRALVQVTASDPDLSETAPSPTPKQAGCPNGNWTVVDFVDQSMNWTSATVVVKDETGLVQLDLSYTCTTFFKNGVSTGIECVEN